LEVHVVLQLKVVLDFDMDLLFEILFTIDVVDFVFSPNLKDSQHKTLLGFWWAIVDATFPSHIMSFISS
jgi:hypothetical protein